MNVANGTYYRIFQSMQGYSDQEIIIGCKENNPLFQKKLYEQCYNGFLKICMRYTKDEQEAEQTLHDSFLKIFKAIGEYEGKGSFEGWMKRIVVNCNLDFLRSKMNKDQTNVYLPEDISQIHYTSKDASAVDKLSMKELMGLVQTLPQTSQTVFNMFVFDGYSHREIAQLLQISEGTSQWHVNNARKVLQEKIKNLYQ